MQGKNWGKYVFIFIRKDAFVQKESLAAVPQIEYNIANRLKSGNASKALSLTTFSACICRYESDGTISHGWTQSQADILAKDWILAE